MSTSTLYNLHPPARKTGTLIKATDPELKPPLGYAAIPGYHSRLADVRCGRSVPFWGTDYSLLGGSTPPDFVDVDAQQNAVSEPLRLLLIRSGARGLHFFPISVSGTRMYILGVEGRVEINPAPLGFQFLEGAEVGLYREAGVFVSTRIAKLIQEADLVLDISPAEVRPGDLRYLTPPKM